MDEADSRDAEGRNCDGSVRCSTTGESPPNFSDQRSVDGLGVSHSYSNGQRLMNEVENLIGYTESTSTELLRRVVSRDDQAWCTFFELYQGLIISRCRSLGVHPSDYADIVQNVLQRVHRAIPGFRRDKEGQSLRRWLRTITRNVISDYFNSLPQEKCGYSMSELARLVSAFDEHNVVDAPTELSDSDLLMELRPILELVKLDYEPRTWDAFWRTSVDGEETADVCTDLGMLPGTVRQARHKILKRLRKELIDLQDMM